MHDAPRLARALLAHDGERVVTGGSRVDHERLARGARRADVRAKAPPLPFEVARQAVIVESGLADCHNFRARRESDEIGYSGFGRVLVIGVYADGRVKIRMRNCKRMDPRPVGQVDRNAKRVRHVRRRHRVEQRRELARELRKIEMAMGIDEHAAPSECLRRGPPATSSVTSYEWDAATRETRRESFR